MSYQVNVGLSDKTAKRYVAYFRVSTSRQGASGLGLEAQQKDVANYLKHSGGELLQEFVEVESGKKVNRPQLEQALKLCKKQKATLLIAKLDRLARNVSFVSNLMASSVNFIATDNPHASKLTIHILAAVAENEAELISIRTKQSLAMAKLRGVKLGTNGKKLAKQNKKEAQKFAQSVIDRITLIKKEGVTTFAGIARKLNELKVKTPKGGAWYPSSVKRVVERVAS